MDEQHIYKTGAEQQDMRVQTKALRYWKTEHKNLDNCQDFYALEASQGLFAVADGAGTTLFPAIWARILALHFVHIPLMSKNPFEIEWWVRLAQDEYKTSIPQLSQIQDPFVRQKAQNQGSDSTLATVRISSSLPTEAEAELLVFGDSCVIIGNTSTREVKSFVLQDPDEFAQAPICLPSTLKFFNRSFHTCSITIEKLRAEHQIILASDAVSKWILSAGNNRYSGPDATWNAFQAIYNLPEQSWPAFIEECRDRHEMVNDDATALILTLFEDTAQEGEPLGFTTSHDQAALHMRKEAFDTALQEQNSELLAIYYGDGKDLRLLVPTFTDKELAHAREVADALKELLRHFRQYQNTPGLAARMQPFWRQYGPILQNEKCAENIRATLQNNGVNLSLSPVVPTPLTLSQFKPFPTPNPLAPVSKPITPLAIPPSKPPLNQPVDLYSGPGKDAAERDFLKVYDDFRDMSEDDQKAHFERLLDAFDTLETTFNYYKQPYTLKPIHNQYIQQARRYKQALENLQRAFRTGYAENIVNAYNSSLISNQNLIPTDANAIQLSQKLLAAYQNDDDIELLTTFDAMQQFGNTPSLPSSFQFTEEDHKRIQRARQRLNALKVFKTILGTGRLTQIAASYNPILDASRGLSKDDRDLLQLAQEFVSALFSNDAEAIVAAQKNILLSPYRLSIALDETERLSIANAQRTINEKLDFYMSIAAKVKNLEMPVDRVHKACLVNYERHAARIRYADQVLASQLTEEERLRWNREKQEWQEKIAPKNITINALRDLINDYFIEPKIKDEKVQNDFLKIYQAKSQADEELAYFQQIVTPSYQEFLLLHDITESEIKTFIAITIRYNFYKTYFLNQQQNSLLPRKTTLDDWLEKQRREVIYLHDTLEQTAQWISENPYWSI